MLPPIEGDTLRQAGDGMLGHGVRDRVGPRGVGGYGAVIDYPTRVSWSAGLCDEGRREKNEGWKEERGRRTEQGIEGCNWV